MEAWKQELTQDTKLKSTVDWLTEVIRRFSDAALAAKPLNSVNMTSPTRLEKVGTTINYTEIHTDQSSGRSMKHHLLTENGRRRRSQHLKMPSLYMELNCVPSKRKLEAEPCQRLCAFMDYGKGY